MTWAAVEDRSLSPMIPDAKAGSVSGQSPHRWSGLFLRIAPILTIRLSRGWSSTDHSWDRNGGFPDHVEKELSVWAS
jgi:hypothetical protein